MDDRDSGDDDDGGDEPSDPTPDILSARSEMAMARHIANDLAEKVRQRLSQLKLPHAPDSLLTSDLESLTKMNEEYRKRKLAAENAATAGNAAAMDWLLEQLEDDADADHEPHRLGSIILAMAPHETYVMRRPEDPRAAERAKEAQTAYFAKAPFMEEHRPAFISDMARDLVPLPEIDQAIAELHGVGAESEALHLWDEDTFHRAFMAYRHQGSVHVKLIAEPYDHPIRSEKALAHCAELDEAIISLADPEEEEGALAECMRKMMSVNSANRTLAILHYHFRSQDMMDTAVRIAARHGTRNTAKAGGPGALRPPGRCRRSRAHQSPSGRVPADRGPGTGGPGSGQGCRRRRRRPPGDRSPPRPVTGAGRIARATPDTLGMGPDRNGPGVPRQRAAAGPPLGANGTGHRLEHQPPQPEAAVNGHSPARRNTDNQGNPPRRRPGTRGIISHAQVRRPAAGPGRPVLGTATPGRRRGLRRLGPSGRSRGHAPGPGLFPDHRQRPAAPSLGLPPGRRPPLRQLHPRRRTTTSTRWSTPTAPVPGRPPTTTTAGSKAPCRSPTRPTAAAGTYTRPADPAPKPSTQEKPPMDTSNPHRPRSTAFHLQFEQEMDESVLEAMLKKAGIPARTVRTVTPLHEGITFTHLLAEGEWDETTGAAACSGQCRTQEGQPAHRRYHDLTPTQREEFHSDLARGFEFYHDTLYCLADGEFEDMKDVAMTPCVE